jgi:plastocyanin
MTKGPDTMRFARLLAVALLSAAMVIGCSGNDAGWTYAPASITPPPSSGASAEASAPAGSEDPNLIAISAVGIKFEQSTVTAPADTPFQVSFENKDPGTPHNVAIHEGGPTGPELFKGEIFNGVATRVYDVPALDAGAYSFICTVHPTMTGTLNAE